jgi:hypothetical protein
MQHFDQDLNFLATEQDPVTKKVCVAEASLLFSVWIIWILSLFSFCLQAVRRLIFNIKPKDIGSLITNFPGDDLKMLASFKDLFKIFVLDPEKRITVSQALIHPLSLANENKMLILPDLVEHSIYLVKYDLGSCSPIISISVFVFGAMRSEYVDEAWNCGRDGYLADLAACNCHLDMCCCL